jgi:transglutaminase-like putative cysteine protease
MDMDDLEFGHRLHLMGEHFRDTFDYDPQASSVDPEQLFKDGKGSAQAIAHAMIGMLRQTGIPARFASGYVFNPAEGEMGEQLLGATSQHAWVQAWHEGYGWIGVDPVNAKLVGWQYVRTAIGRDYFDVVPSRMVSPADTEGSTETSIKVEIDESA